MCRLLSENMMYQTMMANKQYHQGKLVENFQLCLNFVLSRWINHPDYNAKTVDNDFAIIKLASPVSFSDRVSPICLPSASTNYDNKVATVTGWGTLSSGGSQPSILQKVPHTF